MRAGRLRHRVTVQQRGTGRSGFGEQVITWTDVLTNYPADINPLSGSQLDRAMSTYNETTHEVTMRWHSIFADIRQAGAYRIVFGTRYFDIQACRNIDERGREVVLMCREGLSDGQ